MKLYPWTIQENREIVKDWGSNQAPSIFVYGDTILLASKIYNYDPATNRFVAKDFTADGGTPQALRVTIRENRDSTSQLYSFQDTYNAGILSGFANLPLGQVEWLIAFSDASIKTALDANGGSITAWLEISYLSADGYPSTIVQKEITIVDQVDDGAVGTPPPSSPTYLTAAEISAAYFGKNDNMYWAIVSDSTTAPPALTGSEDKYIIPAGATGAWAGQDGKVAVDDGASWTIYTPSDGWAAYIVDATYFAKYESGSWSALSHNTLTGLQGGAAGEYYHLTNTQHSRLTPITAFGATLIDDADAPTARGTLDTPGGRASLTEDYSPRADANGDLVDSAFYDTGAAVQITRAFGAAVDMGGFAINALASPSIGTDAVNKDYVDNLFDGRKYKDPVEVATTGNIALSGEQTIDGVLTSGSRVLVWQQTDPAENGIYVSAAGAWSRATDADSGTEIVAMITYAKEGTTYAEREFYCTNDSINLGVDAINIVLRATVTNHNFLASLQGGAANEYYHLTNTQHSRLTPISAFGSTLIDDADAATARGTLGLGTIATQNANAVSITGGAISGLTSLGVSGPATFNDQINIATSAASPADGIIYGDANTVYIFGKAGSGLNLWSDGAVSTTIALTTTQISMVRLNNAVNITSSKTHFNPSANNVDYQISATGQTFAFFVNGANGNVFVNTSAVYNDEIFTVAGKGAFQGIEIFSDNSESNTFIGSNVAAANLTATDSTIIGTNAGNQIASGAGHTIIGSNAGSGAVSLQQTTLMGYYAGGQAIVLANCTAIGYLALAYGSGISLNGSTAVGAYAMGGSGLQQANDCTAVGYQALKNVTTGDYNSIFGSSAGDAITTGAQNTALGAFSLTSASSATGSVAIGYKSLNDLGSGNYNIAIGYEAAEQLSGVANNIVIGYRAARNINSGAACNSISNSVVIGYDARVLASTDTNTIVIGYNGRGNGSNTVTIGNTSTLNNYLYGDLYLGDMFLSDDGTGNMWVGQYSGNTRSGAAYNVGLGYSTLRYITSGQSNTAVGYNAIKNIGALSNNAALGYEAGVNITSGGDSVFLGSTAGRFYSASNVALTSALNCIYIGRDVRAGANFASNEIVIGKSVVGNGSNTVTIGSSATTDNYFNGNMHYKYAFCRGYVSSAGATASITSGTPVNLFANSTIASGDVAAVDFTVNNTNKRFDYDGAATKNFRVEAIISMTSNLSTQTAKFYVAKNGTYIPNSEQQRKIGTGSDVGNCSLAWDVSLANGDSVEIYCDLTATGTITPEKATVSIQEIVAQ